MFFSHQIVTTWSNLWTYVVFINNESKDDKKESMILWSCKYLLWLFKNLPNSYFLFTNSVHILIPVTFSTVLSRYVCLSSENPSLEVFIKSIIEGLPCYLQPFFSRQCASDKGTSIYYVVTFRGVRNTYFQNYIRDYIGGIQKFKNVCLCNIWMASTI